MRPLDSYSDPVEFLPRSLQRLINEDQRVTAVTIEPDGVFIYTNSAEWCDDAGSGTFRGANVTEAIKRYKSRVVRAQP